MKKPRQAAKDQLREVLRQQLRDQLLAGAASCATEPVTHAYFLGLRERILTTRRQNTNLQLSNEK